MVSTMGLYTDSRFFVIFGSDMLSIKTILLSTTFSILMGADVMQMCANVGLLEQSLRSTQETTFDSSG